jgi:MT0933-like antitoxin protein
MALADRLKSLFKQGEGAVAANKDKAHQAVDKVAAEADQRTHGKYSDQIQKAEQKANETVDNMREQEGSGSADRAGDQGGTTPGG